MKLAGGHPGSGQVSLPAFAAAALAFFVVSNLLVETVLVLAAPRGPALGRVRQGVGHAAGHGPGGHRGRPDQPGLVPGLALPTAAVYLACRGAIRADRERARAEAAAEQALIRQLQESDRLKRDLLATVSRELKTPLTVILGTLGTLSRRGAALDPAERREFVDMAVRQGTRLKELIEQLLLAARFELTGQEPAARPLVAAARLAHPERELVLHAREALPVRAAPEAVLQVLGNLLDNAAKYSPDWSPVRLEVTRYGPQAVLAVEDTGPGGRAPTASASSSASPSSTRGPPGGPAGSASAATSPAGWPRTRTASCSWPTPPRPATAPASSCASPWPSGAPAGAPS